MTRMLSMFLIGTLIGCSPFSQETVRDSSLIGMDVSGVIHEIGFTPEQQFVIDEPPGVPRGIRGSDRKGDRIELYVRRGDVPFSIFRKWRLQQFQDKSVIGIAREQEGNWSATGDVMPIRRLDATQQAPRNSEQDTWHRADIYLIDWDLMTRVALTPQRVRELAKSKRTFRVEAPEIARLLALHKLKTDKEYRPEDARLVIDLYTDAGAKITYYASQFHLCTADSTLKHPIDEKFKTRFTQLAKQR